MKSLKEIVDAVAVIIGDLLNFKLTGWTAAKAKAQEMHDEYAKSVKLSKEVVLQDLQGNDVKVARTMTPLRYMLDGVMNVVACAIIAYLFYKIVAALGGLLLSFVLAMLLATAVVWAIDALFGEPRMKASVETAETPAASTPEAPEPSAT